MMHFDVQPDTDSVARVAAGHALEILSAALAKYDTAVWVLAGGTAPLVAYKIIAAQYAQAIDWSKVVFAIGDERCVPANHPDSNWYQVEQALLSKLPVSSQNLLRPAYELSAEIAAEQYETVLQALPKAASGAPRFDLLWLGMGEDGHTLSLFPGRDQGIITGAPVIPVYDSPKPPSARISLTLAGLQGTVDAVVLASGASKAPVIAKLKAGDTSLPVAQAATTIVQSNGHVTWLIDTAANNA